MYTYEIVASYSGTVNTGNYENQSPFHSTKLIITSEKKLTKTQLLKERLELQTVNIVAFLNDKAHIDMAIESCTPQKVPSQYYTKQESESLRAAVIITEVNRVSTVEELEVVREWANKIVLGKKGKFQSKKNIEDIKKAIEKKRGEL